MDIFDAIRTRRSVGMMNPDVPTREEITKILDYAMWAPNHRMTEPWRFHVVAGRKREELGKAMEAALKASGETHTDSLTKEVGKPLRAPVVIVVSSKPHEDPILDWENHMATAAAVQNLLLAAHGSGLGAFWRTGATMYSSQVADYLGLEEGEKVIGAVYVGYPAVDPASKSGRRTPSEQLTTWIGWDG